ncbi:Ig-like domain-containing protein [Ruminococcus bromii]|uniref:Ig-like domain-containing protein n=1 Tax=Ruminococcus bromii TaxID=40518 RepID=UPI0039F5C356
MKKSKFTLVIVLGLVLCLLCGTTTTFSWFNRPDVQKGDSLSWRGDYNVTNGENITAVTYVATKDDGSEYSTDPFNFSGLTTVSAHETKYFCTEVKNTGNAPQSISLFLNNSETNKLSVGVNSPLRTYKRFTSDSQTSYVSKTQCNVNKKNLYIATNVDDPTKYTMHTWKNVDTDPTDKELSGYIKDESVNYDNVDYNISYVTISMEHDHARLWHYNGNSKEWFGSDLEITDQNNTYVFKADTSTTMKQSGPSAGISSFYSNAEAVVGKTFDLSAKAQGTVTYTSSKTDVATVDGKGQVIAKKAGKTTVTVTSTGAYGDKITSKCELTVSDEPAKSSYIPIVTNMKIEGKADSDPVVTKVYWYIKNDTASSAAYSLGDVQISL